MQSQGVSTMAKLGAGRPGCDSGEGLRKEFFPSPARSDRFWTPSSHLSSKYRNVKLYLNPHISSWRGAYLVKHRDNFTFTCS
jgi:hypothetical protein